MESSLKQRLIGAAVLVALAVIFLPLLLKGPDVKEPDAAQVPLSMPAAPGQEYETRELPLNAPEAATPAGGVLGMTPAPPQPLPAPETAVPETAIASNASAAPAAAAPVPPTAPIAAPASAPTAAPVAAAPTAEVAAGGYVVNIGSFSNLDNANALVAKLRAQKLPVIVDKVGLANGSGMRVRVGPYSDRATAEAARLRAEGVTGTAGRVVATDAPAGGATPRPAPTAPASTPATPASAAKPTPAANGVGFVVQLSAPSSEAEANALRDKARAQGFSSFVQPVDTDGGKRYRVRVGPVADRAAAEALLIEVSAKLGSKGFITSNP